MAATTIRKISDSENWVTIKALRKLILEKSWTPDKLRRAASGRKRAKYVAGNHPEVNPTANANPTKRR